MNPLARKDKLLVQEVADELVVFDQERALAHRLNRTAAFVWQHSDGKSSVEQIAALLHYELNLPEEEDVVLLALNQLEKAHLLQEHVKEPVTEMRYTRRQVLRKLALVGGLAILAPVVQSITAPTPAMAASACASGCLGGCPDGATCQLYTDTLGGICGGQVNTCCVCIKG